MCGSVGGSTDEPESEPRLRSSSGSDPCGSGSSPRKSPDPWVRIRIIRGSSRKQPYDELYVTADGNFRHHTRNKATDHEDYSLYGDAGFFASEQGLEAHLKKVGKTDKEPSDCHTFKASGYKGHSGPVTGLVAVVCRHGLVVGGSVVNLEKGERFAMVDYSIMSAGGQFKDLRKWKLWYDVGCQFSIKLDARIEAMKMYASQITPIKWLSERIRPTVIEVAIGDFHIRAHKTECHVCYNGNLRVGGARMAGEMCEHVWARINIVANRTKEMGRANRADTTHRALDHLNMDKIVRMPEALRGYYLVGAKRYEEDRKYLEGMEKSLETSLRGLVGTWSTELRTWYENIADVNVKDKRNVATNPFVLDATLDVGFEGMTARLREGQDQELKGIGTTEAGGITEAIDAMIRLENEKRDLLAALQVFDHQSPTHWKQHKQDFENFLVQSTEAWESYNRHITPIFQVVAEQLRAANASPESQYPWADDPLEAEPEIDPKSVGSLTVQRWIPEIQQVRIVFPSSYHSKIRSDPAMAAAVAVERRMREGQARDALAEYRVILAGGVSWKLMSLQMIGHKNRQMNTNAKQTTETRLSQERRLFNRYQQLLVRLGMKIDQQQQRDLKLDDRLVTTLGQRRAGDTHKAGDWLWGDAKWIFDMKDKEQRTFVLASEYHVILLSGIMERWKEEMFLRSEEMFRMVMMLEYEIGKYELISEREKEEGRKGGAVFYNRCKYDRKRLLDRTKKTFEGIPFMQTMGLGAEAKHPAPVTKPLKGKKGGKGKQRCEGLPFEEEEEVGTISSTISASKPPESRRETRPAGSERLRAEVNARAFALPEGRRGVLTYSAIFHPHFQDVAKRMTFQIKQPKDGESTDGPLERDATRGPVPISPRNNDRSSIREMFEAYGNEMVHGEVHVASDWTSDACPKGTRGLCVGKGRTNGEASEEFWASFTRSYALDVQRKGQKSKEAALHQAQKRLQNWVEYGTPFSKRRRDDDEGDVEDGPDVEARALKRRREHHERSQGGSESHVETDGEEKMECDD
ncbi:uncharacterized protein BXZ73DRAFT_83423 [Epithele typhae]|uniref:uncharacterized protein n=1 Tax=Epithele typhae TaxID=378194 RepID=UPI002008E97A|nr:uncharacterized protein BXZ73DRAFT_83423 [Epithele typhae]KAH9910552.1 hypothetical protein BXZ73DRAFT_83423 [Epithele typhae]